MQTLVIDFETYYDKDVTLTKLSYSEYVARAKPYLAGLLYENKLYTIEGFDAIKSHLRTLPWDDIELVAHNAMFDGLVLAHWIDRKPAKIACTLSASRALYPSSPHDLKSLAARICPTLALKDSTALVNAKGREWEVLSTAEQEALARYCKHDTLLCAALFEKLYPQLPQIEKDLIDQTHQMWLNPMLHFDTDMAQRAVAEELIEERKLLNAVGLTHGEVRSNAIFTKRLADMGYTLPTKWSAKQQKEVPALAKSDTELNAFVDEHPELAELIDLKRRVNSNIKQSRTERLINIVEAANGKLPVGYLYHGALTGRMSGANSCNLQNLPRGSVLRQCIMAPPEHHLVVADYSQIEVRVNAWLNNEQKLLDVFAANDDPYVAFARVMYRNPTLTEKDKAQRQVGKAAILGLGYGMGSDKFQIFAKAQGADLDAATCIETVAQYRNNYSQISAGWRILGQNLYCLDPSRSSVYAGQDFNGKIQIEPGRIRLPGGRYLVYENVRYDADDQTWRYGNNRKLYGSHLMENLCQAIARDVMVEAILAADAQYPVVMNTHDEIVLCVPDTDLERASDFLLDVMHRRPSWATDLPLTAKISHGQRYGDAK